MASLVQGIEHSDLLASPSKMLDVIRDATDAMTTDTGLDQDAMLATADSHGSVKSSSVQFVTAPNMPDPDNDNNVVFQQPQAQELFNAIAHDTTRPGGQEGQGRPPRDPGGRHDEPVQGQRPGRERVGGQRGRQPGRQRTEQPRFQRGGHG